MSNRQSNADRVSRPFAQQNRAIQTFILDAVDLVLSRLDANTFDSDLPLDASQGVERQFVTLLEPLSERYGFDADVITREFFDGGLDEIVELCRQDFDRYPIQDPALSNLEEVFFASNGFWATIAHRIAHALRNLGVPVVPRAISGFAHSRTGVDIHPGAKIGPGLFIDHGTGIAIGCTAVLHENVSLYNGVVLGTRSKPAKKTDRHTGSTQKRHPTIESGVSLYTNAFVGGDVTVGKNAIIGAYAFVTDDVPSGVAVKGKSGSAPNAEDEGHGSTRTETQETTQSARPAILGLIGNTPVVPIRNLHQNPKVKIYAKLEGSNPSGSVKDRVALSLIERAEESGVLTRDKVILESTSGNTGIGLAMVGAAKGYEVVLTMSSAMSEERKKVVRAFGATLVETDPKKGTSGAIEVARQMASDYPDRYWMARQHSSLDNPLAHYEETADEILRQVPGVTHFVAGIGTFGTLRGAGVRLRKEAGVKVVGIEPVLGQAIQGLRNMNEPNPPQLYDESLLDAKRMAMADSAYETTRLLAEKEGLLVGMSSGAAMYGALELAETLEEGTIVVLFPDRGEKYLSTSLFDAPGQANLKAAESSLGTEDVGSYQI
ncbi:MAG: pyridoxal-phosphate dependent enzyme [Planctomycetota bacterium]